MSKEEITEDAILVQLEELKDILDKAVTLEAELQQNISSLYGKYYEEYGE